MKKSKALILKYMPSVDGSGNVSKNLLEVGEVKGYFLPFSSEMASNSDGYFENDSWNFYYKGNNSELLSGNVIRYDGTDFTIVNITVMGRIKIVKLSRIVGTKSSRSVVQVLNY